MQQDGTPALASVQNLAIVPDVTDILQFRRQVFLYQRQEAMNFLDVALCSDFVEYQLGSVFVEDLPGSSTQLPT